MIRYRRLLSWLLFPCSLLLITWGLSAGQTEPPVRLQRKARPAEVPAKEDPPAGKMEPKDKPPPERPLPGEKPREDDEPPPSEDLEETELLNRVSQNMRTSEDRLANRELGEGTRQVQRDILEDLDKLINKMNQQADGSESDAAPSDPGQEKQRGQQAKGNRGKNAQRLSAQARGQQKQGGQGSAMERGVNNPTGQTAGNNPGLGTGSSAGQPDKVTDDKYDIWGHLPETLREQMYAYSRQEYMLKYADAIKQYYATVAEKGRRKVD